MDSESPEEQSDRELKITADDASIAGQGLMGCIVESVEPIKGPFSVPLKSTLIAECLGTCVLVQLGCAANCVSTYMGFLEGAWEVGVIWGFALTLALYCSAAISGGHFNPALSLSFALVRPRDFSFRRLVPYWVAQLLGGILAGSFNLFLYNTAISRYEEMNNIVRGSSESIKSATGFGDYWSLHDMFVSGGVDAFFIEAFGTAVFFFVIFAVTHPKSSIPGPSVPPIIGFTLGVLVTIIGPLTGAGLNPARDLGPRIVTLCAHWGTASFQDVLPYIVGPLFGGPIGAFVADQVLFL